MPNFKYQARSESGQSVSGVVEAATAEAALAMLKEKQLIVVSLKANAWPRATDKFFNLFNRIRRKDVIFFARQLAVMLNAGVPLIRALRIAIKQAENVRFRAIIADIAADVDGGAKFSQALSRYHKVFDNFFVHLVRAGETTGRLDKVLVYLADQIEKNYALRSRITGAMIYPAFIFSTLFIMGIGMMIFVIPKFEEVFSTMGIELPVMTRILIGASKFMVNYWWAIILVLAVIAVVFYLFNHNPAGRYYLDLLKIKLPIVGTIVLKTAMVRFSRSLSSLLVSGVPVTKSLEIVSGIMNNVVYRDILLKTVSEVEMGKTVSSVLAAEKTVPILVTNMISVGEESGKIDMVLTKVADFYEGETESAVKALVSLIEPAILIIIGLAAMGLILSILMPMYQLTSSFA